MKKISTRNHDKYKGCIFSKAKGDYFRQAVRIIGFTDKGVCIWEELPFVKIESNFDPRSYEPHHKFISATTFIDHTKPPVNIKTKGELIKVGKGVVLYLGGICWEQLPDKNYVWHHKFSPPAIVSNKPIYFML